MYTMAETKMDWIPALSVATQDARRSFNPNNRWEREYNSILQTVAGKVNRILERFDPKDPRSSLGVVSALQDYSNELLVWAKKNIGWVIYNLNSDNEEKWKAQSATISRMMRREMDNPPIGPLLKEYMESNVKRVQNIPLDAAKKIQDIVLENIKSGQYRSENLAEVIRKTAGLPESVKSRAKLIARTETARMTTGLTKARCDNLNMGWYAWRSTHDIRVRSSHKLMDWVLVSWDNPPSPEILDGQKKSYGHYHPGEIFNCRCYARPLVRVDDVDWPAKVYWNGRIARMNKSNFMKISAGQIPL